MHGARSAQSLVCETLDRVALLRNVHELLASVSNARAQRNGVLKTRRGEDGTHRYTRDLAQPTTQVAIARRDDVAPVGGDALHDAVVGVRALVRARQTLKAGVPRDAGSTSATAPLTGSGADDVPQCKPVLLA